MHFRKLYSDARIYLLGETKLVVFAVTCQERNGPVGREFFFQLKCTFLLLQHRFYIHNRTIKLKLAIVYSFNYLRPIASVNDIWENVEKKVYSRGILERVGRVTVNTSIFSA